MDLDAHVGVRLELLLHRVAVRLRDGRPLGRGSRSRSRRGTGRRRSRGRAGRRSASFRPSEGARCRGRRPARPPGRGGRGRTSASAPGPSRARRGPPRNPSAAMAPRAQPRRPLTCSPILIIVSRSIRWVSWSARGRRSAPARRGYTRPAGRYTATRPASSRRAPPIPRGNAGDHAPRSRGSGRRRPRRGRRASTRPAGAAQAGRGSAPKTFARNWARRFPPH